MRASCWHGKHDMRIDDVPEPSIMNRRDAIVRVTATAICGSDLHLYDGFIPTMKKGDILGHEFMGEVVEVGPDVPNLRAGDRVVVPFPIACGNCRACEVQEFSHSEYISRWQKKQLPQAMGKGTTTRSPRWRSFTAEPVSTTSPMNSWPRMSPFTIPGTKPP